MHSESTTDLSIIYSNLKNCNSNQENVVLLKTGAFNPIHRSHISNLIKTKEYLTNIYNLNVIGGYISPSHDIYVKGKLQDQYISSKHRIEMCQKAIQEENQQHWLAVDKAESMAPQFVSLTNVTLSLQNLINQKCPLDKPIRVIYVAGLDLFNRCHGMAPLRQNHMGGLAVVYRPGENPFHVQSMINQNPSKLYFVSLDNPNDQNDISSTLIRQKLQRNEDCSDLTYTSVLQYLQNTQINN